MPKQINVKLGFQADTSQAQQQIQALQQQLNKLMSSSVTSQSFNGFNAQVSQAQSSITKLSSALSNSMNMDTGKLNLNKFNQELANSNLSIKTLATDLNSLGPDGQKAFLNLANSIVTAQRPMIESNKLLDSMWVALKNTARWQLSSSILHGFIGSLQSAYGYAQDLNKSLNSIRIVSGQSTDQMAKFADQANRAAQSLSTSTLAYTDAALIFYQQGLEGEEVNQRVETVLKMSNVTGESAEDVSSYMTAIWNNFNDGSESLESYADKITALGAATASSSREIANGMQQFAAVADTVGLSYDYAATALATVVAQTRQSESVVGNSFRTIFSRLQGLKLGETLDDGTDLNKYSEALGVIGVNIKDQNGQLKDMDTILDEIGSKWGTLAKDQQIALAQTVGGVRQYTNLVALFDNWEQFQKNLTVTQNAEGALQEQADIYAESWEAAGKRVKAAWQAIYQDLIDDKFFIGLTNKLAGILKTVDGIIDSLGGLKGLLPGIISLLLSWKPDIFANGLKNIQNSIATIKFPGQKESIATQENNLLTKQAIEEAEKLKVSDIEDTEGRNVIIKNLQDQLKLNGQLKDIKKELTKAEFEYYSNLVKSTEEYAKQSSYATKQNFAANKKVNDIRKDLTSQLLASNVNDVELTGGIRNILGGSDDNFNLQVRELAELNGNADAYNNKLREMGEAFIDSNQNAKQFVKTFLELADAQAQALVANTNELNSLQAVEIQTQLAQKEIEYKSQGLTLEEAKKKALEDVIIAQEQVVTGMSEQNNQEKEELDALNKKIEKIEEEIRLKQEAINLEEEQIQKQQNRKEKRTNVLLKKDDEKSLDELDKIDKGESKYDNSIKKSQKNIQGYRDEINELNAELKEFKDTQDGLSLTNNETEKALEQQKMTVDELKASYDNLNNSENEKNGIRPYLLTPEFSEAAANTVRDLSTITMGINSLFSIIDTWNNKDLSLWDKLRNSIMSLSFAIPGLLKLFPLLARGYDSLVVAERVKKMQKQTLTQILLNNAEQRGIVVEQNYQGEITKTEMQQKLGNLAKEEAIAKNNLEALSNVGLAGTFKLLKGKIVEATTALWGFVTTPVGAILAGIAAVIAVVTILNKIEEERIEKLEEQREQLKQLKENASNLSNAYKELDQTLNSIADKRKTINQLKEGTQEWQTAVNELNSEMASLIEKYDLIEGKDYNWIKGQAILTNQGETNVANQAKEEEQRGRLLNISTTLAENRINQNDVGSQRNAKLDNYTFSTADTRDDDAGTDINTAINNYLKSSDITKLLADAVAKGQGENQEVLKTLLKEQVEEDKKTNIITEDVLKGFVEVFAKDEELRQSTVDYSKTLEQAAQKEDTALRPEIYNRYGSNLSEETVKAIEDVLKEERAEIAKTIQISDEDRAKFAENYAGWTQDVFTKKWFDQSGNEAKLEDLDENTIKQTLATEKGFEKTDTRLNNIIQKMDAEAKQVARDELAEKFSLDGKNDKGEIEAWLSRLSDEDIQLLGTLEIDYGNDKEFDTIGDIQEKFRKAIESKPIELDTSGFTKKQTEELQEEFQSLTNFIYENADSIDDLDEHLKDCHREASKVARAIMRVDDAIQNVDESYETWDAALKSGSMHDYIVVADDMAKAYGNMLDIDGSQLSDTFLSDAENLNLLKEASEGVAGSYEKLQDAAREDLIVHLVPDDKAVQDELRALNTDLQNQIKDLEIGASLDDTDIAKLEDDLTSLAQRTGLTAAQITDLLSSMGADVELTEVPTETETHTETQKYWQPPKYKFMSQGNASGPYAYYEMEEPGKWVEEPTTITTAKPGATAIRVVSAHKSAGGDFKYKQASHGGGSGASSSSSGNKKSGSSTPKAEKTVKKTKENEEKDRYHDIKEAIDDLNTSLERLNKNRERAFGKQRLKYMDQEIQKTKDQIKLTQKYIDEIKSYQKLDRSKLEGMLSSMGLSDAEIAGQFDENGVLKSYENIFNALQESFNKSVVGAMNQAEDEYNAAVQAWNASSRSDSAKEALDAAKERYQNAQNVYKEQEETFKEQVEILKQYEETVNLLQEKQQELIDQQNEVYDLVLERIDTELEFKLSLEEDDRKLLEWVFKYIGDSADYAADKIANLTKQFKTYENDIASTSKALSDIFAEHGIANIDFTKQDAGSIVKQLEEFAKSNDLPMIMTQAEIDQIRDYMEKLMNDYDQLEEKANEIHETLMEQVDEWLDRIDKENAKFDTIEKKLRRYLDMIDLVGAKALGVTQEELNGIYDSLTLNAKNQMEAARATKEALEKDLARAREEMENAVGEESRKRIQKDVDELEEKVNDAAEAYAEAWQNAAEVAKDAMMQKIDLSIKYAEDAFGRLGLELSQEEFARQRELEDLYLPDYKKFSDLNKSTNQLKKSLQDTNNAMIKGKMYDLLDEINAKMASGVEMSETETGIIERRVALLQAEAQLRDAQNAKSAVRMTRDNEGNFSYTYTADQDAIDSASENYQEKFRELMEFEQNAIRQNEENLINLMNQRDEAIREAYEKYGEDEERLKEAVDEIYAFYDEKMQYYLSQLGILNDEQARLRDEDWQNMEQFLGLRLASEEDFTTKWSDLLFSRITGYETEEEFRQNWADNESKILTESANYWDTWQKNIAEITEGFKNQFTSDMEKAQQESNETKDKVVEMADTMSQKFDESMDKVADWEHDIGSKMGEVRNHITQTVDTLNEMIRQLGTMETDIGNVADGAKTAAAALNQAAMQAQWAKKALGLDVDGDNGGGDGGGEEKLPLSPEDPDNPSNSVIPKDYDTLWYVTANGQFYPSYHLAKQAYDKYKTGDILELKYSTTSRRLMSASSLFKQHIDQNDIWEKVRYKPMGYASGGYTGNWGNSSGKLAVLHSKELVLNKEDTENMLNAVQLVRQIVAPQLSFDLGKGINYNSLAAAGQGGVMEQQVHIDASFPNVQSHTEIELALNNLINSATQYVNRKK